MKKRIQIQDIQPLKESFQVPEGYFDLLSEKIEAKKGDQNKEIRLENIPKLEESYQVPEGYFDGLIEKIEERKDVEDNVVSFRKTRIRIWGGIVAAACVAMVIVSVINFGNNSSVNDGIALENSLSIRLKNVPDNEIACLIDDDCNEEFILTEDEIIELIEHKAKQSESTAIIDYLEEDGTLEDGSGTSDEEFIESI
jgi:hypothetical protein